MCLLIGQGDYSQLEVIDNLCLCNIIMTIIFIPERVINSKSLDLVLRDSNDAAFEDESLLKGA